MVWLRRGLVSLFSLLLLVCLLGAAYSTGLDRTAGNPQKVKTYLAQSRIYDHFIAYVADQAGKSAGADQSGSVSLSDASVQSAAKQAFPSSLVQQSVNGFIDANYAWLEGKTATPQFKIDLSAQKETFAQKVGRIVQNYTAGLPVCTAAQAAAQKGVDPLAATCRPKYVSPAAAGAQTTRTLSQSTDFLNDPVITASSVNPKGDKQGEPYYKRLSQLPKAYRLGQKLPYIFGVLSVLLALGMIFAAATRRKGLRAVGVVLAVAGVILVISKIISTFAVNKLANQVFNDNSVGQLQKSLTDFLHRVVTSIARTDLMFGVGFLVLALIILFSLISTRPGKPKRAGWTEPEESGEPTGHMPLLKARKRLMRPFGDSIMPLGARPGGNEPEAPEAPVAPETAGTDEGSPSEGESASEEKPRKRRKRPRLIQ